MIKNSLNPSASHFTFYPKPDPPKKLQRSHTKAEGIQRTPSTQHINNYIDNLQQRPTDKKRSNYSPAYPAPVLLEQNKTLLAENREMAMLIHERNLQVQALQKKYEQKIQGQIQLLRQIEAQKQRFVGEVIRHKQQTDQHINDLQTKIRDLLDQRSQLETAWQKDALAQKESIELDRKRQLQKLNYQYQNNLTLLQGQKMKLKTQLEQRVNELQVREMQSKQRQQQLRYEVQKAKEEAKHSDHLRKIELAESKHYYETKIQKNHLEHRRDKELFLVEHESQIKKLEEEIEKLKLNAVLEQTKTVEREQNLKNNLQEQVNQRQRLEHQIQESKSLSKQIMNKEKKTLHDTYFAQTEAAQAINNEQVNVLLIQNKQLLDLLAVKKEEVTRLYSEIDMLRDRYCSELEQNQKITTELFSKIFTNQVGNQQEKELLKVKLGVLRQGDLRGLRDFFQNQNKMLNQRLIQKDTIILQNRQKLHEQLRKKDEMRKRYQLQSQGFKSQILQLNARIKQLSALRNAEDRDKSVVFLKNEEHEVKEEKGKDKALEMRQNELLSMQEIITAKDLQIEQLEGKIKLLKNGKSLEIQQKQMQMERERGQTQLALSTRDSKIDHLQVEVAKLKQQLKKQKDEREKQIKAFREQKRNELESAARELSSTEEELKEEIIKLKNQLRNANFEIAHLKKEVSDRDKEKELLQANIETHHVATSNRQKERLEEFYLSQLKLKEDQIIDLRQRNSELASDIVDSRQNYASLEKKLESLIQSQGSLREIERKVMNLGKQNNLIKNKQQAGK